MAYSAAKASILNLTMFLAREWAPRGVRVNSICPGNLLDSPLWMESLYDQYVKDWNEWPAKTVTDLSGLALFTDTNADGLYDPAVDIPGQPGAATSVI